MMEGWGSSLTMAVSVLAMLLLGFFLIRTIRRSPQAFSKPNLEKSLTTIGLLALLIIVVVAGLVYLLRHNLI